MSSEVLLPVATLVLGIVLGYVADWLREKRTTERERRERWKTFQRETILEAQELAGSMFRVYSRMAELLEDMTHAGDQAGVVKFVARLDPLDAESRIGVVRMSLLESRIEDQELVNALHNMVAAFIELKQRGRGDELDGEHIEMLSENMKVVDRRVMELLPDLY